MSVCNVTKYTSSGAIHFVAIFKHCIPGALIETLNVCSCSRIHLGLYCCQLSDKLETKIASVVFLEKLGGMSGAKGKELTVSKLHSWPFPNVIEYTLLDQ